MPTVLNLIFLRRLRADCLELDFFDGGFVPTVLNLFFSFTAASCRLLNLIFLRRLRADCLELVSLRRLRADCLTCCDGGFVPTVLS